MDVSRAKHAWAIAALSVMVLALGACSDDGSNGDNCTGDFCLNSPPVLKVTPLLSTVTFTVFELQVGETSEQVLTISNDGEQPLVLQSVVVEYTAPPGSDDGGIPALQIVGDLKGTTVFRNDSGSFPQAAEARIRFTRPVDGGRRDGTLVIRTNDPTQPVKRIGINVETGSPQIATNPLSVDFLIVPKDKPAVEQLTIVNLGDATLNVSGFQIRDDIRFGVKGEGYDIGGANDKPLAVDLAEAIRVEPGESTVIDITFVSDVPTPAEGSLLIFSNDPVSGFKGHQVPLVANKNGPCITVDPVLADFGAKLVGQLAEIEITVTSCGTEPLEIDGLRLAETSSGDFTLDLTALPEGVPEGGPTPENPVVVPVNESVTFHVAFVPDAVNPRDEDFRPIPDEGTLVITSNGPTTELEVPLRGAGAEDDCPKAVIDVAEGDEVIPQTVLHLDGTRSYAPYGLITNYSWSVEQPDGSVEKFIPGPSAPDPVFKANVVGIYKFMLDVRDEYGTRACEVAEYTVLVQPDKAIHVELTWVTPNDDDESDDFGTDVDLHFVHPNADGPDLDKDGEPDKWFDEDWDCFWHNVNPAWSSFDPGRDDDPSLDRDDTDGAGPENLNLGIPEDATAYRIGVHYWDARKLGDIEATLRVFWYADMIYEKAAVPMKERDMWCVGDLNWVDESTAPEVVPCASPDELIVPDYSNPFFFQR